MNTSAEKTAVLVLSCDKYSDLWRPFFEIFWKRWPDCPYPVYLGSNHKTYSDPRVRAVLAGDDKSWANSVRGMLDQINVSRVILLLEDFIFLRDVDTKAIERLVDISLREEVDCLRLRAMPPASRPLRGHPGLGEILCGEPYRVSAQAAIWNTRFLRRLLLPKFSAWDFEFTGTLLSDRWGGKFWCVQEQVLFYRHCVERGLWLEHGIAYCRAEGAEPDLSVRGVCQAKNVCHEPLTGLRDYDTPEDQRLASGKNSLAWRMIPKPLYRLFRRWRPRPGLSRLLEVAETM